MTRFKLPRHSGPAGHPVAVSVFGPTVDQPSSPSSTARSFLTFSLYSPTVRFPWAFTGTQTTSCPLQPLGGHMAEVKSTAGYKDVDAADMPSAPLLSSSVSPDDFPRRPFVEAGTSQEPDGSCTSASCRICMDDENTIDNPLISPCLCAGSTRFVHRQCLARWRATKAGTPAHYRCEICQFE